MKAMLLQPFYFPWIGMFDMMDRCDLFLLYDDAQFVRQSWQTRNRIKTPTGVRWMSVHIDADYRLGTPIREIRVDRRSPWATKHLNQICESYRNAKYFDVYYPLLVSFFQKRSEWLVDYARESIILVAHLLGITTRIGLSSDFGVRKSRGVQKVVDLCHAAGAEEYLDGESGQELYDPQLFRDQGLTISFHRYVHPVYRQLHGEFVSHLSVLDLLMNEGTASRRIMLSGRVLNDEEIPVAHRAGNR